MREFSEQGRVIPEQSRFRLSWDLWIVVLILLSCWLVPAHIAFRQVVVPLGTTILALIDLFFLVDIALNFFTSYRREGIEVTDPRRIATHYLRSMFVVDLLANIPLDLLLIGFRDVQVGSVSVVLLLRLPRLLRIVRLFVIFRRWHRQNWSNSGFLRIVQFSSIVALLIHWAACGWFLLAFFRGFPEDSWVINQGIEAADPWTQYVRALYWTITTMTTVGYGDITPGSNAEYLYAAVVMLLGASLFAYIVGNIASLISHIDSAKVNFWERVEAASQYFSHRRVPEELNSQIRSYHEHSWARNRGHAQDEFLEDLPEPLRLEVLRHMSRDFLESIPLFTQGSAALRNELLLALVPRTYPPGVSIVREGERGQAIYFIGRGKVEIVSNQGIDGHGTLREGEYFGHLSLILGESRTASVRALEFCEMFVLSGEDFARLKTEYPEIRKLLAQMSAETGDKVSELMLEGIVV